jgi:hypothetical protein
LHEAILAFIEVEKKEAVGARQARNDSSHSIDSKQGWSFGKPQVTRALEHECAIRQRLGLDRFVALKFLPGQLAHDRVWSKISNGLK